MKYRPLGKTGLTVSEIGFGAWAIGGNQFGNSYGTTVDAESLAALNRAYELGCTFFDTADVYGHGHSEELLSKALKGWNRDDVILATKGGWDFYSDNPKANFSETYLRSALEKSLSRLDVETIDLYQLHNPPLALAHHGMVFEALEKFRQEGKIRFYGVSIHDPQEGIQAIENGHVAAIQAVYNLFDRRPEATLLGHCAATQTGIIAREPLANGFLSGKFTTETTFESGDHRQRFPKLYLSKRIEAANRFKGAIPSRYSSLAQLALACALARPEVSTVIPGCKTVAQVEENFSVSDLEPLSAQEIDAVHNIEKTLA